jgi:Fe-S cluster biogenesis protein NfuA
MAEHGGQVATVEATEDEAAGVAFGCACGWTSATVDTVAEARSAFAEHLERVLPTGPTT